MIDPGHPFSVPFQDLIAALEDRIRNGVEQPGQQAFIFRSNTSSFELPPDTVAVTRVTGIANSQFRIFEPGVHFTFGGNRVTWVSQTEQPDPGSRLEIEFTFRELPPGITDFNPGSVVGTLVRAVAREIKLLYEQMDQAYRRAFIDQASGAALDAVVALLGVVRKPAVKAVGAVTFFRKTPPPKTIQIPKNTRVADQAGRVFVTTTDGSLPPEAPLEELAPQAAGAVKTTQPIAVLVGIWRAADKPETTAPLPVKSGFGPDGRTITLDLAPANLPAGDLRIRYKPLSVNIPIEAAQPGPDGNVNAGTIAVMPTPPSGVDGVTNEEPTREGQDPEPDDRLRDRAKHALERASNATTNAIKFAVLELKGVEAVEVIDHSTDDSIPLGEVRVRYSGGNIEDVRRAVEQTRAAGIIARLETIVEVSISGVFFLIPSAPAAPAASVTSFLSKVVDAIRALPVGTALAVRRLNSLAFDIPGLADVAEAQLRSRKPDLSHPGTFIEADVTDPLLVASNEVARPAPDDLTARVLSALVFAGALKTAARTVTINLQVADTAGTAAAFHQFALNLNVVIRAFSATQPDQPPERIANFTRAIQFSAAAAPLNITPADLAGVRADHKPEVEFVLTAAAFPGLAGVTARIDIS